MFVALAPSPLYVQMYRGQTAAAAIVVCPNARMCAQTYESSSFFCSLDLAFVQ